MFVAVPAPEIFLSRTQTALWLNDMKVKEGCKLSCYWPVVRDLTYIGAAVGANLSGCFWLCFQHKALNANLSEWKLDTCSGCQWYFPNRRISSLSYWVNQDIFCCGLLLRIQALLFSLVLLHKNSLLSGVAVGAVTKVTAAWYTEEF